MKHGLFGIKIDDLSDSELLGFLSSFIQQNKTTRIATPNSEILVDAYYDSDFGKKLSNIDLNLPDGVALRFAVSALTDGKLVNRHTGIDTLEMLFDICEKNKKKVLLLGARQEILELAKSNIQKIHNIEISVLDPGTLDISNGSLILDKEVIKQIEDINPDLIAIALSHKKQISFMKKYGSSFPEVKIMIGVGGALDMIAGRFKRAPKIIRQCGFEWLWRLLIEPTRIGRIIKAIVVFPYLVVKQTIYDKRLMIAIKKTVPEIIKQIFIQK